jgi:hypothetical protein
MQICTITVAAPSKSARHVLRTIKMGKHYMSEGL